MPPVYIQEMKEADAGIHAALLLSFRNILRDLKLTGNEKVLIKPNLVVSSPAGSGVTTDLRIVSSLIRLLQEEGLEEIWVGESSLENTAEILQSLGAAELEKLGARVINFGEEGWISVESPLHLALQRFRVARAILDCDIIISAAKMKTHCDTGVTLSVKNLLGAISLQDRQAAHRTDIHKAIVDVYSYLHKSKRVVSVVDALYALDGRRGPITGTPIKMDLMVSGSDPLAVDAACVAIMGGEARAIPHLALAQQHGLGSLNFTVEGRRLADVQRNFQIPSLLPTSRSHLTSYALSHVFKKRSFLRFADKCNGCGACASNCPLGAAAVRNGKAWIVDEMCIGCLVCLESCRKGALDYRMHNEHAFLVARALYRIFNRIRNF
ncbi:CoB--CoM heterodisulfide reductase iron-sulfur subunit A [uncultured archaeon]|nr:CoB--CoM heterodisulfide reductase iron-sulfur subunit A [uncultured archaeon]